MATPILYLITELSTGGAQVALLRLLEGLDRERFSPTVACLYNGEEFLLSPRYRVPIIDRVGTGDAFAAGVIHSLLNGGSDQTALDFGVAAAAWKHSLYGDFNLAHEDEIERLAAGERSGRIRR